MALDSHNIGAGAQFFVEGRDISRLLSQLRFTGVLGTVDRTRFRAPGYSREFDATLRGGAIGYTGDLPSSLADEAAETRDIHGSERTPRTIMACPSGCDVGKLARMGRSLRNQFSTDTTIEGVLSMSGDFEKTVGDGTSRVPGVRSGLVLVSPNGGDAVNLNEQKSVIATAVTGNGIFALPHPTNAGAASPGALTVAPTDTVAQLQTKLRAIAGYADAVVSGSLNASATGSGPDLIPPGSVYTTLGTFNDNSTERQKFVDNDQNSSLAFVGGSDPAGNGLFRIDAGASIAPVTARVLLENTAALNFFVFSSINNFGTSAQRGVSSLAIGGKRWVELTLSNSEDARYWQFSFEIAGGTVTVYEAELVAAGSASYSGSYTIDFPGSLAGLDVTAWPANGGTGWTSATVRQGGIVSDRNPISAPFSGSAVTDIAATETSNRGIMAVLQVLEVMGTNPTATFRIQHSADDGNGNPTTWATPTGGAFTAMTASGAQTLFIEPGITLYPHIRAAIVSGQITGQFVAAIGFARL